MLFVYIIIYWYEASEQVEMLGDSKLLRLIELLQDIVFNKASTIVE